MIVVLFNGPPRCGKDHSTRTAIETVQKSFVAEYGVAPIKLKFADELKERTHALYGLFDTVGRPLPADHFEDVKDIPSPLFLGKSPRVAYIAVSETYFKPHHGNRIFGEIALQRLDRLMGGYHTDNSIILIADSGFTDEAQPLIERFGRENMMLVRIHAFDQAQGAFKPYTDSRSYIDLGPEVLSVDIVNDMSARYDLVVDQVVSEFIEARLIHPNPADPLAVIRANPDSSILRFVETVEHRYLSPELMGTAKRPVLPVPLGPIGHPQMAFAG